MKKITLIFAITIFLSVFVQATVPNTDISKMNNTIKFNIFSDDLIPPIITKANLVLCDDLDCSSAYETDELYCEGNTCVLFDAASKIFYRWEYRKLSCKGIDDVDVCSPIDYSNPPYQVVMEFSGTTKKSDVFNIPLPTETSNTFNAAFDLKITDSELIVKEEGSFKNEKKADSNSVTPTEIDPTTIIIVVVILALIVVAFYFIKKKK